MQYIQTGDDKHREFGLIAAKYLETLQRSNEQLVKLASLLQKQQRGEEGISEKDRQDLFDMINSSEEDD
jgi:cell division protein FtsB